MGLGADPPAAGGYGGSGGEALSRWRFLEKKLFQCLWIIFRKCLKPYEKIKIVQSSFYFLQFESKTRLKSCISGLNFVSDLAQVEKSKAHCLLQYFCGK